MNECMDIDYESIGRRVREKRRERHLTQETVAELAGISSSFVGHIERGEKIPSLQTMVRIGEALNVSLDYLALGVHQACAMEKCPMYEDVARLMKSYGVKEKL